MAVDQIAAAHADRQVTLARRTAQETARLWRLVDPANIAASWRALLPQVLAVVGTSQATAAASAGVYVGDVVDAYGLPDVSAGRVSPGAFAGVASDGRELAGLLGQPAITALRQIAGGAAPSRALASGRFVLDMVVRTQVADAGRTADGVAIAVRPNLHGYVRMIVGKTCARCLILAGRRYRWNAGFQRHPRCDCRHLPVSEDVPGDVRTDPKAYFDALPPVEQDHLLGQAGAAAVRNGADLAKVVNARRGMETAGATRTRLKDPGDPDSRVNVSIRRQVTRDVAGRQVFVTREAAGRRPRLMPEQILREANGSRDEAIRLLRLHRYIL